MKKKIGFGIIGCGMIANWHAQAINDACYSTLVGVTDINENARIEFADKYEICSYETTEDMFDAPEIDVICICTPSGLHAKLAIQAANAKKHIVLEKPMAITVEECNDIINACEKNRVKITVISQLRFTPAIQTIKEALLERKLGKVVMCNLYMKFHRSQQYYDNGGWKGTWKMDGGGALMNQGIHGIDLIQYIMGPVKSLSSYAKTLTRNIEVEDTACAILEYENNALGTVQSTTSLSPGSPRIIEICGDKGTIILEEDSIIKWDIEGEEIPVNVIIENTDSDTANNPSSFNIDGHLMQIEDMVEAIQEDRAPLVDHYEGKKAVEIITAIYKSSKTGKKVVL